MSSLGLKKAYEGIFEIGAALGGLLPDHCSAAEMALIRRHFSNITPENCMKAEPIEPAEGIWNFQQADALVAFAEANQMSVTGHCLVWHSQCPEWFFHDGQGMASRDLVLRRTRKHIETILERYRGRIQSWDVVNEAIDDGSLYIRNSKWKATVGEDYVAKGFEFAHEIDPEMSLNYNDYSIELPEKRAKTLRLLNDLLDKGLRVDGVGIQGHWLHGKVPYEHIEAAIEEFSALGLKVMITELDIDMVEREVSGAAVDAVDRSVADPFVDGCPMEVLQRQAEEYAKVFKIFLRHREKISRVTFWGSHDGTSWLNGWPRRRMNYPLLFDRQCRTKPAFDAVIRAADGLLQPVGV